MNNSHDVTLIYGDGIGREVVGATRKIIDASGVNINWDEQIAGAEVFKQGLATGVPQETIDSIKRTRVVLKGPLETPVGFGEKSANVTLRKLFECFANIRPVREFPNVQTPYSGRGVDIVVVRENVEDLYAGIEYMQTPGTAETLKLITEKGSEKIIRFAFEVARAEGRKKVHCATKANIMKFSEGTMKKVFERVASDYPEIEANHIIIDNCAHMLVRQPEDFDVIVTTNMNGDILSDLASGLVGGLGFAPGANLGNDIAIFEAVHGSAPKYAGKNVINPTAVLLSGTMMLRHLGEFEAAEKIENALLVTLEDGVLTQDILKDKSKAVSTTQFTDAVIANLGKTSDAWAKRDYKAISMPELSSKRPYVDADKRELVGVDVFIDSAMSADELGKALEAIDTKLKLKMIGSRGLQVYPSAGTNPDTGDFWSCRFLGESGKLETADIIELLSKITDAGLNWVHVEKLQRFDGKDAFSKSQGEG